MGLYELIVATRPWSLPVTVSPVLLGSAIAWQNSPAGTVHLSSLLLALIGGLSVHCFGNLVNTAEDFVCKVDKKENDADDRALVDGSVTLKQVRMLSHACLATAIITCAILGAGILRKPTPEGALFSPLANFLLLVASGILVAWCYTGWPLRLKYHRLGDICILLAFGPLLTVGAAFVHTGTIEWDAVWLSLPVALFTEAILHANNARDIDIDLAAGAHTLANSIGFDRSTTLFRAMYLLAFASLPVYAMLWRAPSLCIPLLMAAQLPALMQAFRLQETSSRRKNKAAPTAQPKQATQTVEATASHAAASKQPQPPVPHICEMCGQFSFGFGMLLTLGVMLSNATLPL